MMHGLVEEVIVILAKKLVEPLGSSPSYSILSLDPIMNQFISSYAVSIGTVSVLSSCLYISDSHELLYTFAKLQKAAISSFCLSGHVEQVGYHWTDWCEILYYVFFKNLSRKIQV
jgi:hypothetical protein